MPHRKSQPISFTFTGICPTLWHASRRYGTPCFFATAPIATASLTSPLDVGTCTMDTSLHFPFEASESVASSASASTCP